MVIAVVLGIWIIAVGAYMIYYANSMKKTNSVKAGWMVSKDLQLGDCKDIPGYIEAVYPKTIFFGVAVIVLAVLFIIFEVLKQIAFAGLCFFVLIILLVWYSIFMSNAQKKYLTNKRKI